jgi:hypothetical protein
MRWLWRWSDRGGVAAMAMATTITDYIDVSRKAADLGCSCPQGMALLPVNFESAASVADLLQAAEAATIRKLLVAEALTVDDITDKSQRLPYVKNKSFEWVAPVLFVSASLCSQNPALVAVALNVLANYATEFFQGMGGGVHEVNLEIVVGNKNKTYKKITYKGPVEGLKDLAKVIDEVSNQ